MEFLNRVPAHVCEHLKECKGIDTGSMLVGMHCRNSLPGGHDIYLFADEVCISVLEGVSSLSEDGRYPSAPEADFTELSFSSYTFEEIQSLNTEETVSGARFGVRAKGVGILLAETSCAYKDLLFKFADYASLIKDGEFTGVEKADIRKYCPKCGRALPSDSSDCPYCADSAGVLRKLLPFFMRYMKSMAAIFAMMVLISALSVISPYFGNSFFIDRVLTAGGRYYGRIILVIVILLSVKLADLILSVINDIVTSKISADITYDLKKTIFSSINRMSMSFFNSRRTGGLMTQIESDSSTLYRFFSDMTPNLLISFVKIIVMSAIMLMMNPLLALITVSAVPVYIFLLTRAYAKSRRMSLVHFSKSKALSSRLSDVISGMREVKAFAKEKDESSRFCRMSFEKNRVYYEWTMFDAVIYPAISFILYLAGLGVWTAGGIFVFKGEMSYGDLLTFAAYMGMLYSPLNYIVSCVRTMGECICAAQRLFEIADAEPDVAESKNPVRLENVRGGVEFKNVSFSYTKSKKIIDKVSFSVEPGSTVGIVGRTGAGKSTIVNLLIRLYDVTDGEILIDGVNIKDLPIKQLRDNIAIVSQETYLFAGTVFENIAYAKPDATYEEVLKAAAQAGAHDFIMKLPDAYQTRIGFGYKSLSGGERQRISIARALLRHPKILILDEATAAMDTVTEQKIERAIETLSGGCTTIMIAHRLSTLKSAEKLFVIEDGRLAECGSHESLLEKGGIYHRLYSLQLEALRNILGDAEEEHPDSGKMPGPDEISEHEEAL